MKYAIEQRIRFIDFMIKNYGYIGRNVVMDFFGIGEVTASRDLKAYKELAPDNLSYSVEKKKYFKTTAFKSLYK